MMRSCTNGFSIKFQDVVREKLILLILLIDGW